jgi:hypothetical protein
VVPEAPRIAQQGFPPNFDWGFISDIDAKTYNPPTKSQSDFTINNSSVIKSAQRKSSFDALSNADTEDFMNVDSGNDNNEEQNDEDDADQTADDMTQSRPSTFTR